MLITEIQLYEALKEFLDEEKAKDVLSYLEAKYEDELKSFSKTKAFDLSVAEVKLELVSLKWDIYRWMVFCMLAASGLIIAALKLL